MTMNTTTAAIHTLLTGTGTLTMLLMPNMLSARGRETSEAKDIADSKTTEESRGYSTMPHGR